MRPVGNQLPLTSARSETSPAVAGPIESAGQQVPEQDPERRERDERTTISPVISSHRPAGS